MSNNLAPLNREKSKDNKIFGGGYPPTIQAGSGADWLQYLRSLYGL